MADNSTVRDLDELWKQARAARRLLEPEWFMCLSYFQGSQWLQWSGNYLHKPSLGANRITVVENRIAGCVRTELAKMTKSRPVFVVTPNTGDEEDTNAADLAERVMRYMWRHLKMHEMSLKALEWSRICGAGFLKCYWDSTIGEPQEVLVGPDGNVITDPEGKAMRGDQDAAQQMSQQFNAQVKSKRIAQGDIRVEVRSPFQMFIDPMCDSFPEAEWAIEESIKSVEYAKQRFGDKAQDLKADTPANPGLIEARMMGNTATMGGGYKGVKIREYWCKPGSKHPKGCRIVWSQGKILLQDEAPFDPMPYVMLTGIPVPGRLWPMSIVELLRGPQTELNKVRSQMAENRNRIGNPTLVASKEAVADPEKFLDSTLMPGGTYFLDDIGSPNAMPKYLEAPPLPQYVTDEVERIEKAIEDISGQHEVTNANVPPGVTAASAITLLQEADDTRLGLGMQDYEEQLGRFGHKILTLVAKFYSDARTIKIAGDDGAWEIFDFRGSQLKGNTHVEVQAGSAFPQSKAGKQAMIQDWMTFFVQSGNPPQGAKLAQFLRDSGMGATDRLVEEYADNEQQINRENALLAQGQPQQINSYDDDQAHIDGHERFQRQSRYVQFPDQVKQMVEQHVAEHRQRLAAMQQHQLEMQMQMQGQVPPNLTASAAQDQQQLSQLQGQQQLQGTQQQQGQDAEKHAQTQGYTQAGQEQQQRHAEEAHQQRMAQQQDQMQQQRESHQQKMQQAEDQHQMGMLARQQQAQQQQRQGQQQQRGAQGAQQGAQGGRQEKRP